MSTRTSLVLTSDQAGHVSLHLYRELHDDETHLEIALEQTNVRLNLVIPDVLVEGVRVVLQRAEDGLTGAAQTAAVR